MQDTQRRRLTYAALAGLLLGLGGCGADTIDVTRVSRLSTGATNERFTILLTEQEQNDAQYRRYAVALSKQIQAHGLVPVDDPSGARYAVVLNLVEPQLPEDFVPPAAPPSDMNAPGLSAPSHAAEQAPADPAAAAGIRHTAADSGEGRVLIAMYDLTKPQQPDEKVLGIEVTAPVKTGREPAFLPMIAAAFKDFPGKANETYSVPLPKTKKGK
jgi:hypothetical protein